MPGVDGILQITIVEGRKLAPRDSTGFSDPYCYIFVKGIKHDKKTQTINQTNDPKYNETFNIKIKSVNEDYCKTGEVIVEVWDYDFVGSDEFIGRAIIPMSEISEELKEAWYPMQSKPKFKEPATGDFLIKHRFIFKESSVLNLEQKPDTGTPIPTEPEQPERPAEESVPATQNVSREQLENEIRHNLALALLTKANEMLEKDISESKSYMHIASELYRFEKNHELWGKLKDEIERRETSGSAKKKEEKKEKEDEEEVDEEEERGRTKEERNALLKQWDVVRQQEAVLKKQLQEYESRKKGLDEREKELKELEVQVKQREQTVVEQTKHHEAVKGQHQEKHDAHEKRQKELEEKEKQLKEKEHALSEHTQHHEIAKWQHQEKHDNHEIRQKELEEKEKKLNEREKVLNDQAKQHEANKDKHQEQHQANEKRQKEQEEREKRLNEREKALHEQAKLHEATLLKKEKEGQETKLDGLEKALYEKSKHHEENEKNQKRQKELDEREAKLRDREQAVNDQLKVREQFVIEQTQQIAELLIFLGITNNKKETIVAPPDVEAARRQFASMQTTAKASHQTLKNEAKKQKERAEWFQKLLLIVITIFVLVLGFYWIF